MQIDSHVHFWKYDAAKYDWINKNMKLLKQHYLPQNIALTLSRNDIQGVVAIQSIPEMVESRFLAELATNYPIIKGVVGWVDLTSDRLDKDLLELAEYPAIKGIRYDLQSKDEAFFNAPDFVNAIGQLKAFNYSFDILVASHQLPWLNTVLSAHPEQKFVLNHCGNPPLQGSSLDSWSKEIENLARFPQLQCKLSGLFTRTNWKEWSAAEFYPCFDVLFQSFGIERLQFGSDWPVLLLSGIYVQWKSLIEKYMEHYIPEEKAMVFGENALRFYGI